MAAATIVEELTSIRPHSFLALISACRAGDDGILQHRASFPCRSMRWERYVIKYQIAFPAANNLSRSRLRTESEVKIAAAVSNARYRGCPTPDNRGPFGPNNAKRCWLGRAPASGGRGALSARLQDDAPRRLEPRGRLLFQVRPIEAACGFHRARSQARASAG